MESETIQTLVPLAIGICVSTWAMLSVMGSERERMGRPAETIIPTPSEKPQKTAGPSAPGAAYKPAK